MPIKNRSHFCVQSLAALLVVACGLSACTDNSHSPEWYKNNRSELKIMLTKCDDAGFYAEHGQDCANARVAIGDIANEGLSQDNGGSKGNTHNFYPDSYGQSHKKSK